MKSTMTLTNAKTLLPIEIPVNIIDGYAGNDKGTYILIKGGNTFIHVKESMSEVKELDKKFKESYI